MTTLKQIFNKIKSNRGSATVNTLAGGKIQVKSAYATHVGKRCFDLIFPNKSTGDIATLTDADLRIGWDHGKTQANMDSSVTAGVTGVHIYVVDDGTILGIVTNP